MAIPEDKDRKDLESYSLPLLVSPPQFVFYSFHLKPHH
jgi:hypothetical protein